MDPVTLAIGLGMVFGQLVGRAADITLDKALEALILNYGAEKIKLREAEAKALDAALAQARQHSNATVGTRLGRALNKIKDNRLLAARVAAAVVEMTSEDPQRIPVDFLHELDLPDDERPGFARFLFTLRGALAGVPGYGAGIEYADRLHAVGRLDGLYQLVAGVVGRAEGGQAYVWTRTLPPDASRLEAPYLAALCNEFSAPGMEAVSKDKDRGASLRLEEVYIALNTTERRSVRLSPEEIKRRGNIESVKEIIESQNISALRAVMAHTRVMLLGDPGSGKSTFAQHLVLCLAQARRAVADPPLGERGRLLPGGSPTRPWRAASDDSARWLARLKAEDVEGWALPACFPLFVRLRLFGEGLILNEEEMGAGKHLLNFLKSSLEEYAGLAEHVQALLDHAPDEVLLILDGLDEVADPARREKVAQAVDDFCRVRFPRVRVLVTCRIRQYPLKDGEPTGAWKLPRRRFPIFTLADFEWEQAQALVRRWFEELHARQREKHPAEQTQSLLTALGGNDRLRELTAKPILLTQMCIVHAEDKLPDSRIAVYEQCADLLLWRWEGVKASHSRRVESADKFLKALLPGITPETVRRALEEAAFRAFEHGEAEISGERLRTALAKTFVAHGVPEKDADRQRALARDFMQGWLAGRNGLLLPATGDDAFDTPHPTFREFMAARYLHEQRVSVAPGGPRQLWYVAAPQLFRQDNRWAEVVRFAAGLEKSPETLADALEQLYSEMGAPELERIPALLLAGQIVADSGPSRLQHPDNEKGRRVYGHLIGSLINLLRDSIETFDAEHTDTPNPQPRYQPADRLAAGTILDALKWQPPDLYHFIRVSHPSPERKSTLGRGAGGEGPFLIAQYPVTNAQYERFIDRGGYDEKSLWGDLQAYDHNQRKRMNVGAAAVQWLRVNGGEQCRPRYWDDARFGRTRRLCPVVGVTWYEAAAYCAWLTQHWRELEEGQHLTGFPNLSGVTFRLPLDDEWELAAGGKDNDRYPWERPPSPGGAVPAGGGGRGVGSQAESIQHYANTSESNLGGTTPVCMYPAGASKPHSVMDMAGNVWEWQANFYDKDQDRLALRGGTWLDGMVGARVASRNRDLPDSGWDYVLGFRVVAAPVSR